MEEKEANNNGDVLATQMRFLEAEGVERPVGSLVGLRVVVGGLKTRPRSAQDAPKTPQDATKSPKSAPKATDRAPAQEINTFSR